MPETRDNEFEERFVQMTGNAPFPWQTELFRHFSHGDFPDIAIPTSLGKTNLMAIWLLALAERPDVVPRRLAWVVNRRTVVDQATTAAEQLLKALHERAPNVKAELAKLPAIYEQPLTISTMRGQRAESNEWWMDPTCPAIICGTVDLIGSRLLFRGYRAGFRRWPLYAGLLGQDTLVVHDECHLEPAFQKTLGAVKQHNTGKFYVIGMSATLRSAGVRLTDADKAHCRVQERYGAVKRLHICKATAAKANEKMIQLALKHEGRGKAIVIYRQKVSDVKIIAAALEKKHRAASLP